MAESKIANGGTNQNAEVVDLRGELAKLIRLRHWVVLAFNRQGKDLVKYPSDSPIVGGVANRVIASWLRLDKGSVAQGSFPALLLWTGSDRQLLDSADWSRGLERLLTGFLRSHHILPETRTSRFVLDGLLIPDQKSLDRRLKTVASCLLLEARIPPSGPEKTSDKAGGRAPKISRATGRETGRQPRLDAAQSAAELNQIVEELEAIKEPLRKRLQRVLDGLAERNLESAELNEQVVKQINAVRTALGFGLRLKESGEPIYLRCVVASRAKMATIQAVSANQKRANLAASPTFPAIEAFELKQDS